jgi:hypothetical protein|tara:strand:+ start:236 stop:523 length:288 start_codon:yes stop_codon:yes gene_type:complete
MKNSKKKDKMAKKLIITLSAILMLTQPIYADENNINKLSKKFNLFWECINQEVEETKDFQIRSWKEVKNQNNNNIIIVKNKLTGFFSDFPRLDKK